MAQRMHIDVPPVASLFRNMGALTSDTTRRPAADAAPGPLGGTALEVAYPQVGHFP